MMKTYQESLLECQTLTSILNDQGFDAAMNVTDESFTVYVNHESIIGYPDNHENITKLLKTVIIKEEHHAA
jgi:small nuclear ribonucleoprotein (snRNP)-like protein